jgi:putative pyruvate formate lyase activating enzyme
LPHGLAGTENIATFLAQEVSTDTYLNIMAQYHPCHHAFDIPQLSRPVSSEEFHHAIELAHQQGLDRLDRHDLLPPLRLILG